MPGEDLQWPFALHTWVGVAGSVVLLLFWRQQEFGRPRSQGGGYGQGALVGEGLDHRVFCGPGRLLLYG